MAKLFIIILTIIIIHVSACSPQISVRGNLPDADLIANIEPGYINKRQVIELIGSPSTIAPFSSDTWYFVSEITETTAFFKPKIKERKVLVIEFDRKGIARKVKTYGLEDARNLELVERVTPTAGKKFNVIKQIFGNIGRFEGKSEE